ncbi:unnamed protein product [Chironomus riparius]|uniref:Uncharacterized protein n=1 Tax=Chironomus riparius TaxID=315576 RepID=A0A9N9RMA4_9DIPT|nr:unnamed protein product [Chironomus riparius]
MKKLLIISLLILCVSAGILDRFKQFVNKHRKNYARLSAAEKSIRQRIFLKNLNFIDKVNKFLKNRFKIGLNEFSDRDPKQFIKEMCKTRLPARPRSLPSSTYLFGSNTLDSVDWRRYAQPIAHQGGCGACWAFSAASVVEFFNVMKGNWNYSISEQNIVDCDYDDFGCDGGWPKTALDFLKNSYGNKLAKEIDYPFIGMKASCRRVQHYIPLNIANTFEVILNGNETTLKSIVANQGPVATAMLVSDSGLFQLYESGIFDDPTCPETTTDSNDCFDVNHGVVIVGYGKDSATNEQFWIVRNSWGTDWGESGYFRMIMGKNACNIACYAIGVE